MGKSSKEAISTQSTIRFYAIFAVTRSRKMRFTIVNGLRQKLPDNFSEFFRHITPLTEPLKNNKKRMAGWLYAHAPEVIERRKAYQKKYYARHRKKILNNIRKRKETLKNANKLRKRKEIPAR